MTNNSITNEIAVQQSAAAMRDTLYTGIEQTQKNIEDTINAVRNYIETETERGDTLAKNISACNAAFEKLTGSAENIWQNSQTLQNKLDASCAALSVIENHKEILGGINANFANAYGTHSNTIQIQLQRILDRLTGISHQCLHFQTFPKPYKDMIDLYSVKIEQVFGVLPAFTVAQKAKEKTQNTDAVPDMSCAALFDEGTANETPLPAVESAPENAQLEKIKKLADARKGWLIAAALALGCVLIFGIIQFNELNTLYANSNKRVADLQTAQLQFENSKSLLQKEIAELKTQNLDYQNKINILEDGIRNQKTKEGENRRLQQQVRNLQAEIAQMQKKTKKKR